MTIYFQQLNAFYTRALLLTIVANRHRKSAKIVESRAYCGAEVQPTRNAGFPRNKTKVNKHQILTRSEPVELGFKTIMETKGNI